MMMTHPAMRAYKSVAGYSLSGRDAEASCFKLLLEDLETAAATQDVAVRNAALDRHQRLWSMIMKANTIETGVTAEEDRRLFVTLANKAQRYGVRAILDPQAPLTPLIEIAENVCAGLEGAASADSHDLETDALF